ncbi:Polyketide synthase enoylreductase [Penicillium robsamsonii]|uniref:Polyketide synthase enoylreductase n=1 Tax=Penicillium robsamsonii TaxID=1792511 RepID=UPI0025473493|nr:Polyketide synthase enoylreductase [Penicillium robsamsonii]KAJ5826941.1 Polyketide synthase enoylreductase [Penicillium robsamsonii]
MTQTPENKAAWLSGSKVTPLEIGPAPYTAPGPHQIVVKNSAVGINQVDWAKQLLGEGLLGHISYPFILGEDVAGTVVEVGEGVERFSVGDRVVAAAAAISLNSPLEGGFQLYTVVRDWLAAPLPDSITFEQASVIPLAIFTASHGLFDTEYLGLDLPTVPALQSSSEKGAVIITGGSSAVGSTAIQLAVSAGYEVVTTASPKNFDYVKKLGATHVFDYKSETVVDDISAVVKGLPLAGGYSIGDGSIDLLAAVLVKHEGPSTKKVIALAGGQPGGSSLDPSVAVKFILLGPDAAGPDSVTGEVYKNYLPEALANGQFVPSPEAIVVGKGLEKIQVAFGAHMQGVSAKKIVVSL